MLIIDKVLDRQIFKIEIRKIIFYICICLLTVFSFNVISNLGLVLKLFFTGGISNHDLLVSGVDDIMESHANLLSIGFCTTVWLIFRRKISVLVFTIIAIVIAGRLYPFLDQVVHPFFMRLGVLDYFLHQSSKDLNPQYTRLVLFLIVGLVLLVLSCFKKFRTIDRTFGLLICWVVIVTTFLFHITFPMGLLRYIKADRLNDFVTQSFEMPKDYYCKDKTCILYDKDFNEVKGKFKEEKNIVENYNGFFKEAKLFYSHPNNRQFPIYGNNGNFIGVISNFYVCHTYEDGYFCAIKEQALKDYGLQSQLWFAFLTTFAHFIWLFGGFLLLGLHKNRKIKVLSGV